MITACRSCRVRHLVFAIGALMLAACGGPQLSDEIFRPPPTYASPPATSGLLAELAGLVTSRHGADHSAFKLLDSSFDGLYWRLAVIDSATTSLDIQTYLWYPDESGRLVLERAIHAANRGVRVRLIVDDLLTLGQEQLIYELDSQPNIEFRLFNPWKDRGTLARAGDILGSHQRVDVPTALKAMTIWPAWQHFEEDRKGSIEPGKLADFAILSADPTAVDPEKLADLEVRVTIKENAVIYDADATPGSARLGLPVGSDPDAAHHILDAIYDGIVKVSAVSQ